MSNCSRALNILVCGFLIAGFTPVRADIAAPKVARFKQPCVNIYFDKSKEKTYRLGKTYSIYLQNLMGHFPEFQQIISPVEQYRAGDIEKCVATFYIGSYFDNLIPDAFIQDYKKTKKNFAWIGYNIWKVEKEFLEQTFGYQYSHLTTLDTTKLDEKNRPTFFRYVDYKGERFEKFGAFVGPQQEFRAGFEMVAFEKAQNAANVANVLAVASHNGHQETLPYILQSGNQFYIADVPFSFIHESDRYLVFADVLFDILNAKPRHKKRNAIIRIEDVHPLSPLPELYKIAQVFAQEKVPLHISIVPVFFDPLYKFDRPPKQEFVPMTHEAGFMSFLESLKKQEAEYIWHGTTHQYGRVANPHTGYSTDDFEFWDAVRNAPLVEDSVGYVLNRLDFGFEYLKAAGIEPSVWLTPHYQASALDSVIFGRAFPWGIGRAIYFEHTVEGLPAKTNWDTLHYASANSAAERNSYFKDLKVKTTGVWSGQLYPYEIYGDYYGQRLLPEILGNPQPFENAHVVQPRTMKEIVADAKRNLVLRDTWASLFFHPYLLTDLYNDGIGAFPGDSAPLVGLIRELKGLGYEFISAQQFIENNDRRRPEPIYVNEGDTP